jgi:hypothetical protein
VVEGKTPEIGPDPARATLKSIDVSSPVGLRDRAFLAVLIYTAARMRAVARLTIRSLTHDGSQHSPRFSEKGGKSRDIPVRHDLEGFLLAYVQAADITDGTLFRTANRRSKTLTNNAMTGIDICRMMKRRLKAPGLPTHFSPHSFRVTTVNDLLEQNVPLEDVQYLAGHSDQRTTRGYGRRRRKVTCTSSIGSPSKPGAFTTPATTPGPHLLRADQHPHFSASRESSAPSLSKRPSASKLGLQLEVIVPRFELEEEWTRSSRIVAILHVGPWSRGDTNAVAGGWGTPEEDLLPATCPSRAEGVEGFLRRI